ncbi:Metallo-dependent phosphatase-like protein [Phaeosphaeriaceae sp. PMI808]|nr:Metallo-dependent phosphatase-like protein [Phaeosphaeriaceae sp. PMI808]
MRNGIRLLLLYLVISATSLPYQPQNGVGDSIPNYLRLRFSYNGKFSITVFSDLHFGEPEWVRKRPNADLRTISVMNSILDEEKPNLVVFNGDMISCEYVAPLAANGILDEIMRPLVDRDLPFAATFGNHDSSETCSTRSMSEHMWNDIRGQNNQQLSFTTQSINGSAEQVGAGNYVIPVYSSSDEGQIAMLLWFFDSRGGRVFQPGINLDTPVPGYVHEKVVSWFQATRDEIAIRNGRVIPSLVFVHIPVQATRVFQESVWYGESTSPGLNYEIIGHQDDCAETDCYNHGDVPFMKALVETEGLMAVFSGHDHGIDWCMKWAKHLRTIPAYGNGVHFCFNRHSGFGGYSNWKRGARQIVLDENELGEKVIETWNRLEDGSISGLITLNSTYGDDQYSKVESLEICRYTSCNNRTRTVGTPPASHRDKNQ